jgi:hypothetical protein
MTLTAFEYVALTIWLMEVVLLDSLLHWEVEDIQGEDGSLNHSGSICVCHRLSPC